MVKITTRIAHKRTKWLYKQTQKAVYRSHSARGSKLLEESPCKGCQNNQRRHDTHNSIMQNYEIFVNYRNALQKLFEANNEAGVIGSSRQCKMNNYSQVQIYGHFRQDCNSRYRSDEFISRSERWVPVVLLYDKVGSNHKQIYNALEL